MFTISYGVGNVVTKNEADYSSFGSVLNDTGLQSALSFDPSQVEARVNGSVVDNNAGVTAGLRIELVKKAGRKSLDTELSKDNQLMPMGIPNSSRDAIGTKIEGVLDPMYDKLNEAENDANKKLVKAQRKILKECKPFGKYVDALIEQLVNQNYVDKVGSLAIPQAVRDELNTAATESQDGLKPLRTAIEEASATCEVWRRNVQADLAMCVTVKEQRGVFARIMASDPLEAWTFEA
jgi:hypothetical protein